LLLTVLNELVGELMRPPFVAAAPLLTLFGRAAELADGLTTGRELLFVG
jgi:hypothetical protein